MRLLVLLLWGGLMFPLLTCAADPPEALGSLPIEVTAQQLEALEKSGEAVFTGEVVARQGDLTLYCDKLVIYRHDDGEKIDRLEASGNVRVVQLDRTASADRVIYREAEATLRLIGNASVQQGQNQVGGAEIILYLKENRSLVKSGDGDRVRAVLFPQPKESRP